MATQWPPNGCLQVLNVEDIVAVLGPRPFHKSTEYEEFINASYKPEAAPPLMQPEVA